MLHYFRMEYKTHAKVLQKVMIHYYFFDYIFVNSNAEKNELHFVGHRRVKYNVFWKSFSIQAIDYVSAYY